MADPEIPPLDPSLASLFEADRSRTLAPPGAKEAALARITAALARGGALDGPAKHAAKSRAVGSTVAGKSVPALVLALALGGAAGSAVTASILRRGAEPPAVMPTSSVAVTDPVVPPRPLAPEEPELPHESPAPTVVAQPAPAPAVSANRTLAAERRILDRAQIALTRMDPSTAINAAEEHRARFPNGQLEAEREAILIQALVLAHRADDARARAERFRARYPNSVFRRVVELAVAGADEK